MNCILGETAIAFGNHNVKYPHSTEIRRIFVLNGKHSNQVIGMFFGDEKSYFVWKTVIQRFQFFQEEFIAFMNRREEWLPRLTIFLVVKMNFFDS
jgi:hypothetical protein